MENSDQPISFLEVCVRRAGLRKAVKIGAFVTAWALAERDVGGPLGDGQGKTAAMRAYTAYWRHQSERTTWRDLALFTEYFPTEDTPERIIAEMLGPVAGRPGVELNVASDLPLRPLLHPALFPGPA